jgi:hypothetical protein
MEIVDLSNGLTNALCETTVKMGGYVHEDMCRFETPSEEGYQKVRQALQTLAGGKS